MTAPRDTLDGVESKFTDQFFASTEGRNDIRRQQIQAYINKQVEEAKRQEFDLVLGQFLKLSDNAFQTWCYRHETKQLRKAK